MRALDKQWDAGAQAVDRLFRAEASFELQSQKSPISTPSRQRFCLKAMQLQGGSQHHSLESACSQHWVPAVPASLQSPLYPSRRLNPLLEAFLRLFCCLLLGVFQWELQTIQLHANNCSLPGLCVAFTVLPTPNPKVIL